MKPPDDDCSRLYYTDNFLTHTVQMKRKGRVYVYEISVSFLTHTVQMKLRFRGMVKKEIQTS